MNAGIISILLHQLPYQFKGLGVLSTIAFLVDFVFFICFSVVFLEYVLITLHLEKKYSQLARSSMRRFPPFLCSHSFL